MADTTATEPATANPKSGSPTEAKKAKAKKAAIAAPETTSTLDLSPLVLKREQVAALLQVSEDTIENLHRGGELKAVKCGKHNRWRRPDVEKYIEILKPIKGDLVSDKGS